MAAVPFVVGQWVRGEKFYGRGALIDEVLKGNRDWLWLLGTRRVGKTSLLRQVEHLTSDGEAGNYFPVFWDFQGAADPEELHQLFLDALLDAEERLEQQGISLEQIEGRDLFVSLGRLRRKLRAAGRRLLLLCDEVEELIQLQEQHPSLLAKLRRALQSQEDIRSVLASSIRLWALAEVRADTSPFLHGFAPPLYINQLGVDAARSLVRQDHLSAEHRPPLEAAAVERIVACCDGHPYLIQLVGKRSVELGDVEEAIEQVSVDPMVTYFFSVDYEMLSATEQDILRLIARSTAANSNSIQGHFGLESNSLAGLLQRLEKLGYVHRNQERRFELNNFFFRKWLVEQPLSISGEGPTARPAPGDDATEPAGFDERYELRERVGEGMFGVVYRAHDRELDETIALKVLRSAFCNHGEVVERFRQEILLSRDLAHPNIARIYHLGEWQGRRYLTMKWIAGPTLRRLIDQHGALGNERTLELARKLASALAYAHERRVIHRDIKPSNILIDAAGEPYVTDFGLARLQDAPSNTGSGVFVGTPEYASPEQANLLQIDERSDVYALGVVLFEMATGRKPFEADSVSGVLELHRHAPPPSPRDLRPEIPPAFAEITLRCLEKDPARRFAGARELHEALAALEAS